MTQPITSRDPWTFHGPAPLRSPASPAPPPPPPRHDVSDLPDAGGAWLGRLTASPAPPIDPHRDATRALAVAQRLDAFRALATPTFHTREGDVAVPIPFHMAW